MLIAQISDLHVHVAGDDAYGVVNSIPLVERAIAHLNQLRPRPDVVVATGDLTHRGQVAEYEVLRSLLLHLEIPIYLLPGNHDEHHALCSVFGNTPSLPTLGNNTLHYLVDSHPIRLLLLDTVVPHQEYGVLDTAQLHWLDHQLAAAPETPAILFMHHPPFPTGIDSMDQIGLQNSEMLAQIVARHKTIERIAAGHLHRPIFGRWANTVVSTAPSLVHQVSLNLCPDTKGSFVMEPPAYQLHLWHPTAQLITHVAYVEPYPGPYPFPEKR